MLFDLDGTLYAQLPVRLAMLCEMAVAVAVSAAGLRIPRTVRAFRSCREALRDLEPNGEPLVRRQYSLAAARLGCSPADVEEVVDEWIYRRPLKWLSHCRRSGVVDLLDFLGDRHIRRGVFSDYPAHDKLVALGLASRFDLVMSAVDPDVDAFKPDPRGYLAAAARWHLPPSTILYVGDRPEVDARGAAAAGMPCAVLGRDRSANAEPRIVRDFRELHRVIADLA